MVTCPSSPRSLLTKFNIKRLFQILILDMHLQKVVDFAVAATYLKYTVQGD